MYHGKSTRDATGLGLGLLEDDKPILFGTKGDIKTVSPLRAEAEVLLWTMQEMLNEGQREIHLESVCEQLVKFVHMEEEWPALASELDEIKALCNDLSFIPRSKYVCADHLAKDARSREVNSAYVNCFALC
ncbi:hypothetical protein DY000_02010480 [Brassica cretica]|uniref:RNase H type-1 domain-containing protein n=1 Tax=Brassica cretica TaxID=69181 RepID=A0ABQ7C5A2_BRACR|nr:hypothetical protein DY000_02010480 [Brassica cretica]